ncbi:hypothetical protein SCOR_32805 [Sulfidibacter corallicola]|uniref:Uncharacterized protein n=1 Tax=Sulfidibacter corallicola TaxID=2818388 RepID=A0A8A4TI01_SULCO|nr:hypothetical protein [Sulfidibacter corallicola]QTD49679.1 hypothetical protein J3U87_29195 [Sulfidibacter corallicola]
MAYHSASGTAPNKPAFYDALKSFATTIGWSTIDEDTSGSEPFTVFQSPGESGQSRLVVQVINRDRNHQISVYGYQSWDSDTHAGVNQAGYSSGSYVYVNESTDSLYWLFGDLDHLFTVVKIGANYFGFYAGLIKSYYPADTTRLLDPVPAGNHVTVSVNDASPFEPDQHLMILDTANVQRTKLVSLDTENQPHTVTLENL